MKKILGILLAMSMLFTTLSVSAYSDISNREDITVLTDLGIIDGFEDNTFRADEDLTRAQLVKVICTLLGYTDISTCDTSFSDVKANHWASGYINFASSKGIVAGFEDGTFRPDDKVSYEQAVKMVVCALGYEPAAKATVSNNWYNGYLNIASSIGVIKGVNGTVGKNFTRGSMAKLLYNALTTQMMDVSSWGSNGNEYSKTEDTILSKYLEIEKWEGILSYTTYMNYMAGGDETEVRLADSVVYDYENKKTMEAFSPAKCDKNVEDLLGKKVICYAGEDDKGDYRVFSIAEKDNYNTAITIKASKIVDATTDYVQYENENGKLVKLNLADSVTNICNYAEVAAFDPATANGYITFVSNDNDKEYDYIIYFDYDVLGSVVKDIEKYDDIISFDAEDIDEFDYEDDDVTIIVKKDGKTVDITDITVDDVISVVGTGDFKVYFVSSKNISGKVTGIDTADKTVTIDGKKYDYNGVTFTLSDYVTAYFNIDDEIVAIDTDDIAINKYGMILRAYENSNDDTYKLEVLLSNGIKTTYDVSEKRVATVKSIINGKLGFETGRLTYEKVADSIFSLTIKNSTNEVTAIKAASVGDIAKVENKTFDEETMTFGPIDINKSTVMFSVEEKDNATDEVKANDVSVGAAVDFFVDDEGEDFTLYPLVPRNEIYSIIVGTGISGVVSHKSDAVIIETVTTSYVEEEDDTGYVITGLQGGKEVEYTLFDCAEPSKGDVILIGTKDNGVITKYTTLVKADDINTTIINGAVTGKVKEYAGLIDRDNTDNTRLYFDNGTNILLKSSANYTLVDCTGTKITVEKKTKGISIFGSADKYKSYAYVRYYDDTQTEVIVYRFIK